MSQTAPQSSSSAADRPIGVFDSGLGGLTVVRELARVMPGEDIVYLGDTARVPYGSKSASTVRRFAQECAAWLERFNPKLLVVACNTASAAAIDVLRQTSPVDVVDVVGPGAAMALERTSGAVGVIATVGTIASGAYQRAVAALDPNRRVLTAACPLLVPMVEEGRDQFDPIIKAVLSEYLRDMQRQRPGALVLGCTHYPLLSEVIQQVMGPDVALVSSARAAASEAQRRLTLTSLLSGRAYGGQLTCFSSDNPELFARLGERFGSRRIDHVEAVATEQLEQALREKISRARA